MQNLVILGTLWWIKTLLSILSTQPLGFLFFLRFMNYNKIKCVYHFVECFANDERLISDFYDHGVVQAYQANLRCTLFVFSSWVFAFYLPWLLMQTYRSFAASFWFTITQPKSLVKNSHDCRTKKQESYLTMTCIDDHWQHLSVFWNSKCWMKEGLFLIDIYIEKKLFLDQELEELTIEHCKKATSICSKQFSLQVVLSQYMQIFCMLFYCIVKSWILGSEDWCVYNNTDQSYPWCMSRPTPGLLLLKKL